MELHALLGQQPGSNAIQSILKEATEKAHSQTKVPLPEVKVYRDAVYHSYRTLGLSLNFEPAQPLSTAKGTAPPDPSQLTLVAIHVYKGPTDKFSTFPMAVAISVPSKAALVEVTMEMEAHEWVALLGEPEEKQGGGRSGNCWIGYQRTMGVSVDFAGASWESREMALGCLTLTQPGTTSNPQ